MARSRINGITMHYMEQGSGAPVVLVHGLTSSLAFWHMTKVYPTLSADYRVVAYDLRGHGYSDTTPTGYTSRELAGDLLALLDHLGTEKARIVSHSFGGSIALHFALLYPQRTAGVVLCDTGFAALRYLRKVDNWPGWEIWKKELPEFGITPDWFNNADEQGIAAILEKSVNIPVQFGLRRGDTRNTPRFRRLLDETSVAADFRDPAGLTEDRLGEIAPPILAVYGDISPFRNVALHLSEQLPNCAAAIIPNVGHFFLLHAPELFFETVAPFLRDPVGDVELRRGRMTTAGVGGPSTHTATTLASRSGGAG